jgi:4-phytase / acid phosphatase
MQTSPTLTRSTFLRRTQRVCSLLLCIVVPCTFSFAQGTPAPDNELKLVVGLFRHGVRSPESGFMNETKAHSKKPWPTLADWQVMGSDCEGEKSPMRGWGYLTTRGFKIVNGLGAYYGKYYQQAWSKSFKAYFWADAENQRTRYTARALADGFNNAGVADVTVRSLSPCSPDLLFHPFPAGCGSPDTGKLAGIASDIKRNWQPWTNRYKAQFDQLFSAQGCTDAHDCNFDDPDSVTSWSGGQRKSPISWSGRFSYASGATEAFLLEYANNMKVGWGSVAPAAMVNMLSLHEFYFDQTQREQPELYLAKIQGSNLVKEIFNVIKRRATGEPSGCPHAPTNSQFVGLVGHDTNLANVGALLGLSWKFDDPKLPADTKGLPANDALPAGALVFELRQRNGEWFVRVEYVTQSLSQMKNGPVGDAFRLRVFSADCSSSGSYCEMPLPTFIDRVNRSLGTNNPFLSRCIGNNQTCLPIVRK